MKSPLFFAITEGFDLTTNEQLKQMAAMKYWDKGLQKYLYFFPTEKLREVKALTGQSVLFNENELLRILRNTHQKIENYELEKWKGKSGYDYKEFPIIYHLIHYQKEKGEKPKEQVHVVQKETVERIWKVFLSLKKGKYHDFAYLAEKVCKEFELSRFFRPISTTFDHQKFQGSRGEGYFPYYYYPIKVLELKGYLIRKGQNLKRILDEKTVS